MKPQAKRILAVLSDGNPHSAMEFKSGLHGFFCDAVSQRVGEIRREGHRVSNVKRDGGIAVYQLEV
jgi:nitric oxide reductase activation protein